VTRFISTRREVDENEVMLPICVQETMCQKIRQRSKIALDDFSVYAEEKRLF
jgi:hypothetical protein